MRWNEEGDAQVPCLSFRVKDKERIITFEGITNLLSFNTQARILRVKEEDIKEF